MSELESRTQINKKNILRTILITFCISILSLILFFGFFSLVTPRFMAQISYKMGAYNYSSNMYYSSYSRTDCIDDIYNALVLSINAKNDENIIKYFQFFEKDENFEQKINEVDDYNCSQSDYSLIIRSSLRNTENYLKNKFVISLLKENFISKANYYCKINFSKSGFGFSDLGDYLFSNFVYNGQFSIFDEKLDTTNETDDIVKNYIYNYLCDLNDYFITNYSFENNNNFSNYIECCNRLIVVGSDLKNINLNSTFLNDAQLANINSIMLNANNKIKQMVA